MTRHALLATLLILVGCPTEEPPAPTPAADDDDDAGPATAPFTVLVEVRVDGTPTEGVSILQGGGPIQGTTDADGRFLVTLDPDLEVETWAVAALADHRSEGVMLDRSTPDVVVIEMARVQIDNPDYEYGLPGVGGGDSTAECSHCHVRFAEEFGASAHRIAASDPQVHDLFAGTAAAFDGEGVCVDAGGRWLPGTRPGGEPGARCYVGVGVLPDATAGCGGDGEPACDDPEGGDPTTTGRCADCHAPGIPGPAGGGHSLLAAEGIAFDDGVHCDFCHKIRAVEPAEPPGVGGRLQLGRPLEEGGLANGWVQVMYGPYPDVLNPFMGGAWAPVFGTAELCRGCHEYEQAPLWDGPEVAVDPARWPSGALPVHSTYSEWAASALAPASPCQTCHMPPSEATNGADQDLLESIEPGVAAGFLRAPGTVRTHSFVGPDGAVLTGGRLIDTAATVVLDGAVDGPSLTLTATVTNSGAGHAFPTGEPMRSAVLVLDATCEGEAIEPASGDVISGVGGALATGVVGEDVTVDGTTITWEEGLAAAQGAQDLELRVVRPRGTWDDYEGVPPFASGGFPPDQRGRALFDPVFRGPVTGAGDLVAAEPPPVQAGDVAYLARTVRRPADGDASLALAGLPGRDFARVLVDAGGTLQAPHHRANDVLRDDRILPSASREVAATFTLPDGCTAPEGAAVLVYRKYPLALARERGWDPREIVAASAAWAP